MSAPAVTRALFACDGADVPADLDRQPWDVRDEIVTTGGDPNLNLVVDRLERQVTGDVDPTVLDLIRLGAYCLAADQTTGRGGDVDVHREAWRRELTLCVPVSDPERWSQGEVVDALRSALGFGTDDAWNFRFCGAAPGVGQVRIRWADGPSGQVAESPAALMAEPPGCVLLFSGGTDSLCALVEAAHLHKRRPVVVSHWPAQHIHSRQNRLFHDVQRALGLWAVPRVAFELHRSGDEEGEGSQRARAFLYACLGAAVAVHHGVRDVLLAVNGYVSVNPPINDQLVGALASRGTHPKFLALVNRFLAALFAVQVENPLWNRTRAEALRVLVDAGRPELLRGTFTCGKHRTREKDKPTAAAAPSASTVGWRSSTRAWRTSTPPTTTTSTCSRVR